MDLHPCPSCGQLNAPESFTCSVCDKSLRASIPLGKSNHRYRRSFLEKTLERVINVALFLVVVYVIFEAGERLLIDNNKSLNDNVAAESTVEEGVSQEELRLVEEKVEKLRKEFEGGSHLPVAEQSGPNENPPLVESELKQYVETRLREKIKELSGDHEDIRIEQIEDLDDRISRIEENLEDALSTVKSSLEKERLRNLKDSFLRPQGVQDLNIRENSLLWLAEHQTEEGFWDCDEFMFEDKHDGPPSDGPGNPVNDVGVTGLAMLALMPTEAARHWVRKGGNWLVENQNSEGLFGQSVGNSTMFNHAIATLALATFAQLEDDLAVNNALGKAVKLIESARNTKEAWRYSLEADGENDSSITGWMVFALKTAEDAGINVSKDNYVGALNWFKAMTDPGTGRTGYAFGDGGGPGGRPSRNKAYIEKFPPEKSEALTAVSLLCRIFMTDIESSNRNLLQKQADLLVKTLPTWSQDGSGNDLYYWYFGTIALRKYEGPDWTRWKRSVRNALSKNQRKSKGNLQGSWDPNGPWGENGGRVYSTALGALILSECGL